MNDKHVLLIGPLPIESKKRVGGAKVSFSKLVEYAIQKDIPHNVINIDFYGGRKGASLRSLIHIFKEYLRLIKASKVVMLNFSQNGAKYIAPILYILSRVLRKKVVFRMFGGDMKSIYLNSNLLQKKIWTQTILKSDIVYLQTQNLLNFFNSFSNKIKWLPTSRYKPEIRLNEPNYRKRFVFISQIKKTKGVEYILEAIQLLPKDYIVHLYGPIHDADLRFLEEESQVYKGILKPEEVIPTLHKYDVLLLPTFHEGEGYPGVIIESYSLGKPVITTKWISIPEIVENEKTGFLIPTKSVEDLIEAITKITNDTYIRLSKNALEKFNEFDAEIINRKLISEMNAI